METVVSTVDLVVIGSGAAGLSAAVAAASRGSRVVVIERSPVLGGTTAVAGGAVWIPDGPSVDLEAEPGETGAVESERERAVTYMRRLIPAETDAELIDVYVDSAAWVMRSLYRDVGLRWIPYLYPDYYPELSGAVPTGRTFGPVEFIPSADQLGPYLDHIRQPPMRASWQDAVALDAGYWVSGRALVGTLVAGALRFAVEFMTDTRANSLTMVDGAVRGVRCVDANGREIEFECHAAVIACGGYEHSRQLCQQHLGHALEGACSPPWNEGDGLAFAAQAGADLGNLNQAWWQPVMHVPGVRHDHAPAVTELSSARVLPGSIMVNASGHRFVNEALNYHAIGQAMMAFNSGDATYPNLPAWLIFGDDFARMYGAVAFEGLSLDGGWAVRAKSLDDLATAAGIDASALTATVTEFNADARAGRDRRFGRGESEFARALGDPSKNGVFRSLGPIGDPPYYSARLGLGAAGTKGGPRIDPHGRVLDWSHRPIPGLYAAGNASSSVMGASYPGGGSTIGPALTFGYRAGAHSAQRRAERTLTESRG